MKIILMMMISFNVMASDWMFSGGFMDVMNVSFSISSEHQLGKMQISRNNPALNMNKINKIYAGAVEASKAYDIPVNLLLAIASVESNYKLSAVNGATGDFGIMQVNQWHVKNSNLDLDRLLTDYAYSFTQGARVFKWFYDKYPLEEAIARYNCGTKPKCITWSKVRKYVKKVKKAL